MTKQRGGFTLIELLVVISIIALLLAILMPALGKVKEAGRRTVCAAHMHDINLSVRIYAQGQDDWLPPVSVNNGTISNTQSYNHWTRWWRVVSGSGHSYWNLGLLWSSGVIDGNGKIFFCPSPKATYTYKDYSGDGFPTDIKLGATGVRIPYSFNPECISLTNRTRKYLKMNQAKSSTLILLDVLSNNGVTHEKGWNVLKGDGSVAFSINKEVQEVIERSGESFAGQDFDAFDEVIRLLKRQ